MRYHFVNKLLNKYIMIIKNVDKNIKISINKSISFFIETVIMNVQSI